MYLNPLLRGNDFERMNHLIHFCSLLENCLHCDPLSDPQEELLSFGLSVLKSSMEQWRDELSESCATD